MLSTIFKKEKNNNSFVNYTKELLIKDIIFLIGIIIKNLPNIKNNDFNYLNYSESIKDLTKKIKICFTDEELEEIDEFNINNKNKIIPIVNIEDLFIVLIKEIKNLFSGNVFLQEQLYKFYTDIYIYFIKNKSLELKGKKINWKYFDSFYTEDLIKFNFFDLSGINKIDEPDIINFQKIVKKGGFQKLKQELEKYNQEFLIKNSDKNIINNITGNQILGLTMLTKNFIQKINDNYIDSSGNIGIKGKVDFNEYTNNRYFFVNEFTFLHDNIKIYNSIIFLNFDSIIGRFGYNGKNKTKFCNIFNNYKKENLVKNIYIINNSDFSKLIPIFQLSEQKLNLWESPDLSSFAEGIGDSIIESSELFEEFKNEIILAAINMKVTDIHIKIFQQKGLINFRLDNKVIQKVKFISIDKLEKYYRILVEKSQVNNTGNFSLPQDGKLSGPEMQIIDPINQNIYNVEVRVNLGQGGDKIYLRLTGNSMIPVGKSDENNKFKKMNTLKDLGYLEEDIDMINRIASISPNGLILVTGATGQGKSTLLFTLLNDLLKEKPEVHMLTIEDPIEMKMDLFNVEQNELKDKSQYPIFIKAFLRQDPDWIMVGETRDSETLYYLKEASLTGHLCFSTFHANNTLSTLNRMINLLTTDISQRRVALSEILSFTKGIISQKLIPKMCEHCKIEETEGNIALLLNKKGYSKEKINQYINENRKNNVKYYKGNHKGCKYCNYTGYKGRQVLVEILPLIDEEIIKVVEKDERPNIKTLFDKGLIYVARGTIDLNKLIGEV